MNAKTLFFAILMVVASGASAETVLPVEVAEVSLSTTRDEKVRTYYILTLPAVQVPEGYTLGNAFLEFLMDVDNVSTESSWVILEVYPYVGQANGELDVPALGATAMKRSVSVGENRSVRVYVTEFLERTINDPALSRGVLVGSMMGQRPGSFSAKVVSGASGEKAKLTIYFDRIEDTVTGQTADSVAE